MEVEWLFMDRDHRRHRRQSGGSDGFEAVLELLPEAGEECSGPAALLGADGSNRYSNANLAVSAASLDNEAVSAILKLHRGGRRVLLFFSCPLAEELDRNTAKAIGTLRNEGVRCFLLRDSKDLESVVTA